MTTWAHFDVRFDSILVSLARHSDLITQEATTIDIIEAKQWRDRMDSETALKEKERTYRQRVSVISWLGLDQPTQGDECERLLRDCVAGSCDWILKNKAIDSWLQADMKDRILWFYGKPGAGES